MKVFYSVIFYVNAVFNVPRILYSFVISVYRMWSVYKKERRLMTNSEISDYVMSKDPTIHFSIIFWILFSIIIYALW